MSAPVAYVPAGHAGEHAARRVRRALRKAGATSEHTAVPYAPGGRTEERALQRLLAAGEIKAGRRDSYWLDLERVRELRHARLRIVAMILLVETGIVLGLALNLPRHH